MNFPNRKLLLIHLSHSHPGVGHIISCKFCEKGSPNKTLLRDHIKKCHPNEFAEIYEKEETNKDLTENEVTEESVENESDESNEVSKPYEDDIELFSIRGTRSVIKT